jgi:hypothetical protein
MIFESKLVATMRRPVSPVDPPAVQIVDSMEFRDNRREAGCKLSV